MSSRILAVPLVILIFSSCMSIDQSDGQLINKKLERDDLDARVFKEVGGRELQLHIFYPEGYSADSEETYPAAASFHGGAWMHGPIEWGYGDAQLMASLGYVGIAVEYRLADGEEISALDCMKDANSAVRWIRLNAEDLNVDPERIAVIGHSAGGHLSLSTALFPQYAEKFEDTGISSIPNAVIALAPAVKLVRGDYFHGLLLGQASAKDCSPMDHVEDLDLPILIIQGTEDEVLPVGKTMEFASAMEKAGNDIELHLFPGGNHVFFYESEQGREFYQEIVRDFVFNL